MTDTARASFRILVHDYAGHPFQVQLSRWLAGRGHAVLHLFSGDVETPRGALARRADDPAGFAVEPVSLGRPFAKYDLARRWLQERAFGTALARRAASFRPDVVLSANAPPAVQARLAAALRTGGVPLVCWVQDIFTLGVDAALRGKPAPVRSLARGLVRRLEFGAMRRAAGIVAISEDFVPILEAHGISPGGVPVEIIENWAPLGEIRPVGRDNPWSRAHGLDGRFVFLTAGTLGLKHNPGHLAALARAFRDDPEVRVVVVSQGVGRARLEEERRRDGLDNLVLLDFQPFERLPEVLATADVAVVLLEDYAGSLSVPSRVYSHFCAGRPLLASVPRANLARRLVEREGAGLCADPGDVEGFVAAARRLRADPALRARMAEAQRRYAAGAFDIDRIGPRFESVLARAVT
ncbi:MAG TPA: glycosyltransferase family 4 protein [Azospirillaceae bacterium]|nr:glycosyltransferase family 4 protein [Azospirillaceae bacterium]